MLPGFTRVRNFSRRLDNGIKLKLWQLRRATSEITPVFLVGCGRSGTSMVVWQLERLWQVTLYNEDHPLAFDNWRLRDLDTIERLVRESPSPLIVFKPILNTHQSCQFLERFPNGRVIFAFRHYKDVIPSSIKKFGADSRIRHVDDWMRTDFAEFASVPPPAKTKEAIRSLYNPPLNPETGEALYWLFYNRLYFDLGLDADPRVYLQQYEATVIEPVEQLRRLCAFLEIPFQPWMVQGIFRSSVKRDRELPIDQQVRAACDVLYERLCEAAEICR
jgi:hypothetical protein